MLWLSALGIIVLFKSRPRPGGNALVVRRADIPPPFVEHFEVDAATEFFDQISDQEEVSMPVQTNGKGSRCRTVMAYTVGLARSLFDVLVPHNGTLGVSDV